MDAPERPATGHAAAARALGRLDAFSFFVLPGQEWNADFAVIGTTGAFLVAVCDLPGVARIAGRRPTVGDRAVPKLRKLRSGHRRFAARLADASVYAEVVAVGCLTQAIAGPPVDAAGVRFLKVDDLARDISARPGSQSYTRAQAAARALGMNIAGDQRRHFTVRG
jgi:hypothetical protein